MSEEPIKDPESLEVPDNIRRRIEELERRFDEAVEEAAADLDRLADDGG
jgi:hypothetical protein